MGFSAIFWELKTSKIEKFSAKEIKEFLKFFKLEFTIPFNVFVNFFVLSVSVVFFPISRCVQHARSNYIIKKENERMVSFAQMAGMIIFIAINGNN